MMIQSNAEPTKDYLMQLLKNKDINKYDRLQNYYEGKSDIYYRELDKSKPNNRIMNNFAGYIVDIMQGYFIGKPVSYTGMDESLLENLTVINEYNDEQSHNSEIAKQIGIKGKAYEILYTDEEAKIRFAKVDPEQVVMVYDNKITPDPLFAVYSYKIDDIEYVELYTRNEIMKYKYEEGKLAEIFEMDGITYPADHFFGGVPINEYTNNDEEQGDFEKVISLIDAYDLMQSDSVNDFEQFADAYLKLIGMRGTEPEDVAQMKQDRVLLLDDNGQADWLIKTVNDTHVENIKNRLQTDIHRFSKTPNLTDDAFGSNLSGVAISYKILGMESAASNKERRFKKSLQRRIELICNILNIQGNNFDYMDVKMNFTRNLPINVKEQVEIAQMLLGMTSQQTSLAQLPMVDDVTEELERLEEEQGEIRLTLPQDEV